MISVCLIKLEFEIATHHFGHLVQMNQQAGDGSVLRQLGKYAQLSRGNRLPLCSESRERYFWNPGDSLGYYIEVPCPG